MALLLTDEVEVLDGCPNPGIEDMLESLPKPLLPLPLDIDIDTDTDCESLCCCWPKMYWEPATVTPWLAL